MRLGIYHEDECDLFCTDNDKTVRADVIEFQEGVYLTVSLERKVKINLQYQKQHDVYIGSLAGMEFQSTGPKRIT